MKTVVLAGAGGRTGVKTANALTQKGHEVKGIDMSFPSEYPESAEKITADITEADITQHLESCDAVVSTLGVTENTPNNVVSKGVKNLCKQMNETETDRIIVLTGAGAKTSQESENIGNAIANVFLKIMEPGVLSDGRKMVSYIKDKDLEWTVLRAPRLTKTGEIDYKINHSKTGLLDTVSRKSVAHGITECLEKGSYKREMPYIKS